MQPKYGPSALSIHTMWPPDSGIMVASSAVMSASGTDQMRGTTQIPNKHAGPPPALMLQTLPLPVPTHSASCRLHPGLKTGCS